MFGKKKERIESQPKKIPTEKIICTLYCFEKNKFGTEVLSSINLCKNESFYTFDDDGHEFSIVDVKWDGIKTVKDTINNISTETTEKSKRTGRAVGATIGTVIAPGIGTVIGAAYGTGNKKNKAISNSNGVSYTTEREVFSNLYLSIEYLYNHEVVQKKFRCLSDTANILLALNIKKEEALIQDNPIEQIKQLKELLDIGALSKEEFDIKKSELLKKI